MKKLIKNEEGQVIALFALLLVVLLGFSALAIDVGMVALTKSRMQNAADAAALAAAQNLSDSGTAKTTAITYAGKNGMKAVINYEPNEGDTVKADTPYDSRSDVIRVDCTREVSYTFGRVLGFTDPVDVSAHAIAVGNKIWAGEALPFINLDDNYEIGGPMVLWEDTGPGDFESIFWKDYTIFYEDVPEKTYITVNISDGITLDKGVDASKKTAIENIVYHQDNKPVYFWSLTKEVIISGKYYSPNLDPHTVVPLSDLILLQGKIDSYEFGGSNDMLKLTVQDEFDINNGEYPTDYLSSDKVISKLIK